MCARRLPSLLLAVISGCAISHPAAEEGELLGSFVVTVELADAGEPSVRVEAIPATGDLDSDGKALEESVLARVAVVGPGLWNPDSMRLAAVVRITNASAPAMDEPYLVVRSVSQPRSCVIFEGTHGGGSHVGAQYRYADVTAPGVSAVNGASSKQLLVIHAPCARNFSFSVDVQATVRGSRRIVPDRDDDSFNIEANEAAGDDCNDNNPGVYPGGPVPCACSLVCGATCELGCCDETCESECSRTCAGGCVCDVHPGPSGSGANPSFLDCQAGSVCNLDCAGTNGGCDLACSNATCTSYCEDTRHNRDCNSSCSNASDCTQQCVGANRSCQLSTCTGGSECTLDCTDTSKDCRVVEACENGSTCAVTCDETGSSCGIQACRGSASCELSCNGTTQADCTIGLCENGSTCEVDCSGAVGGTCGITTCRGGSTCDVTCGDTKNGRCQMTCEGGSQCSLDCGAYTGRSCVLSCADGAKQRCGTTNTWVCPGTPCPSP
jgi:hypothetical protein